MVAKATLRAPAAKASAHLAPGRVPGVVAAGVVGEREDEPPRRSRSARGRARCARRGPARRCRRPGRRRRRPRAAPELLAASRVPGHPARRHPTPVHAATPAWLMLGAPGRGPAPGCPPNAGAGTTRGPGPAAKPSGEPSASVYRRGPPVPACDDGAVELVRASPACPPAVHGTRSRVAEGQPRRHPARSAASTPHIGEPVELAERDRAARRTRRRSERPMAASAATCVAQRLVGGQLLGVHLRETAADDQRAGSFRQRSSLQRVDDRHLGAAAASNSASRRSRT